jgi:hypothetical protein
MLSMPFLCASSGLPADTQPQERTIIVDAAAQTAMIKALLFPVSLTRSSGVFPFSEKNRQP